MINSQGLLESVRQHLEQQPQGSAGRPMRLAMIDATYDPFANWPGAADLPRVIFEGEEDLDIGDKTYAVLNGYVPMPGDRVLMIPTGTTYTIAGKIPSGTDLQGFWSDIASSGTEFGGGSFCSTDEGLVIDGDGDFAGMITHGTRSNRVPEMQFGLLNIPTAAAASMTATQAFSPAWPVGTVVYVVASIQGSGAATAFSMARPSASNTTLTVSILKTDAARANYVAGDNIPVFWVAMARPAIP